MRHIIRLNSRGKIFKWKPGVRKSLPYRGIARRALIVDQLPSGYLPVYDKDIDVSAVVADSSKVGFVHNRIVLDGRGEIRKRHPRVTVPQFEIYSNPTITIADVKRRKFNIMDRYKQKAQQEIMSQEDDLVFRALDDINNTE